MKQRTWYRWLVAMVILIAMFQLPLGASAAGEDYGTRTDAVAVLRQAMVERKNDITVKIADTPSANDEQLDTYADQILELALEHTGKPKEGDYLRFHLNNWGCSQNYYEAGGVGYYELSYNIQYHDSAEHQAYVDTEIQRILDTRELDGKSDVDKLREVYDYLTICVSYDYEHLNDSSYTLQYTAYGALNSRKAVCQGYANVLYRLALELGFDSRIIAGKSRGMNHAWNIVKLDGAYYLLDATWDAGKQEYAYFLEGSIGFADHDSEDRYLTESFTNSYPISKFDYDFTQLNLDETWLGHAVTKFSAGSGTELDPYVIKTPEELALLALYCNQQNENYNDCHYRLGADLDLSGHDWISIGAVPDNGGGALISTIGFHGVFDGNDHTISNMQINKDYDRIYMFGLFGMNVGTIRNLYLKNPVIKFDSTRMGWHADNGMGSSIYAGGLCAYNDKQIEHCTVENVRIDISSDMSLICGGAAADLNYGTMKDVIVSGSVVGKARRAIWIGGCIGSVGNESYVELCGFSGTLRAETEDIDHEAIYGCHPVHAIGGFCGSAGRANKDITIKNCYAVADIYSKYPYPNSWVGTFAGGLGIVFGEGIFENLVGNGRVYAQRGDTIDTQVDIWQGELGLAPQTEADNWQFKNLVVISADAVSVHNMNSADSKTDNYDLSAVDAKRLFVDEIGLDAEIWDVNNVAELGFADRNIGGYPDISKPHEIPNQDQPQPEEPQDPQTDKVVRLAGQDRFDTAFVVAAEMKRVMGIDKFDAVVVASGADFADALSGSYLAAVKKAPILLSYKDKQNALVKDYIRNNLKSGGTVYILGGEKAVPKSMETGLDGFKVIRVAGADRFGTNLAILKEAGVEPGQEILVCTGKEFADSLSASATGLPILLVYKKLTDVQKAYLATLSGNQFCIVGGQAAVPKSIMDDIASYGSITRLEGQDRLATSVLVATTHFSAPKTIVLAYGWNFPDGLCGGPLAYLMNAPLMLTHSAQKLYTYTAGFTTSMNLEKGYVLGGPGLISPEAVRGIFELLIRE